MTNKLFRRLHKSSGPQMNVMVRSISHVAECVGRVRIEPGESAWLPLDMGQRLAEQGKVEIIRYDKAYIDWMAAGKTVEDIGSLPGCFCPECAEQGIVSGWPTNQQLQAHRKTHRKVAGRGKAKKRVRN